MFKITKRKGDRKSEVKGRMACYLTVLAAAFFFFALKYRRWKRKEKEETQNKKKGNRKETKSNLRPFRPMICPFLFYSFSFSVNV
jgi:Na+/melibiose symporter-like transporter